MNNFTKSILYSTTVLAAGLVAIFAIYDGVTKDAGVQVAAVEPAAGESDFGIQFDSETNALKTTTDEEAAQITTEAGEAPAEEEAVATEEVKTEETAPVAEETPAAEATPVTEIAPAAAEDATPVEEVPAAEETPVEAVPAEEAPAE